MTLTVRLKPELETALELHCAERGVSKSLVVQEVLADFLVSPSAKRKPRADEPRAQPGPTYMAFKRAGFIGGGTSDGRSATRDVVRERIVQHLEAKERKRRT